MLTILTIIFVIVTRTASLCDNEYSVKLKNRSYKGVVYNHGEYIVDNVTGAERGCVCMKEICARKCCPLGQAYHLTKKQCIDITEPFNPPVWKEHKLMQGYNATKEFHLLYGKMNCSSELAEIRIPVYPATKVFRMRTDGNLYVEIPSNIPPVFIYGPDKYCIDTFVSENHETYLNALICFLTSVENHSKYKVSSSCMLISCFFILLTVAVYAWLPELRNLHGKVLMAYLLSFFVSFLFLATMQILILTNQITQTLCTVLTFIVYFSLLAAFFWLNVMCYDIWWTFSGKRAHGRSGSANKRFGWYCLYAFSVPTVLTIILGALEFSNLPMQHPLMPKLRLQGCFLYGNSKLLYLYGPIVILCIANMIFFTLTALKIAKIKKETKMLHTKDSSTTDQDNKDQQRFGLYLKLFTVMGINWILEVISSFYPKADFFWQFPDAYNVLVGLIIFIIFVCKRKTLNMIKKRIKDFQRSNTLDSKDMKSASCKTINRWQTKIDRNASLDTIKTTVGVEADTRNGKVNDEPQL